MSSYYSDLAATVVAVLSSYYLWMVGHSFLFLRNYLKAVRKTGDVLLAHSSETRSIAELNAQIAELDKATYVLPTGDPDTDQSRSTLNRIPEVTVKYAIFYVTAQFAVVCLFALPSGASVAGVPLTLHSLAVVYAAWRNAACFCGLILFFSIAAHYAERMRRAEQGLDRMMRAGERDRDKCDEVARTAQWNDICQVASCVVWVTLAGVLEFEQYIMVALLYLAVGTIFYFCRSDSGRDFWNIKSECALFRGV